MSNLFSALLVGSLCVAAARSAVADVDKDQAQQDWQELDALVGEFYDSFTSHYGLEEEGQAHVDRWFTFQRQFTPFFAQFRERYGTEHEQVAQAFEGVQQPLDVQRDARSAFRAAADIDVEATQQAMAKQAVELGRQFFARWQNLDAGPEKMELKLDYAQRAARFFTLAAQLDPQGDYGDMQKQAEEAVEQTRPQVEETLGQHEWPGHNADFEGPGDPDALAAAAIGFLEKNPDWTKPEYDDVHTPIAACVEGKAWQVSKTTILGEPTQYSLDILVAFSGEKDAKIAYCYHMVFYTREELGVEKAAPFHYANSRQYASYKMLLENVPRGPAGGAAAGRPANESTGTTFIGALFGFVRWVLRLVLAATLIVVGLAATGKVRQLADLPTVLALAAVAVGGFCFCVTLLTCNVLADILPQAMAIVLGVTLLMGSRSATSTEDVRIDPPVETKPNEPAAALGVLTRNAVPLGFAGIALGVIHLLLGAWILL